MITRPGHILIAVLCLCGSQLSAQEEWELKRDRDGIQVYTRSVSGSPYDEVRAEAVVQGVRLSALVALVMDAEACAEWADRCAESYVIDELSDTEVLVYTHNDLPFPVKDRDVVSLARWEQDPETFTVRMVSEAVAGHVEEKSGRQRLTEADVSWHFEPLADGSVRVINQAHINPGSSLPGWVTNMLLVDTPFETMKAFLEEVRAPHYARASISFVTEPL
ncbi:MAG: START domain-containing protein [Proteobacteria bacterium]|nr:START domain-containing protein [Pseudomonadota bacterium]MDA0928769.1 START domain-containing protein [Pseudomonadota bacterium]